jgi:hypothetical protein
VRALAFAPPVAVLAALAALAGTAAAEPDLAARARGPFTEASLGATGMIGPHSHSSRVGPAFALRAGLDLFTWLSVGVRLELESHQADVPPPPEGEYYQLYGGAAEARLAVPAGRFALFADGGLGGALVSTNVLAKVGVLDPGERFTPLISIGGGLEYHLANRHYAAGLAGQWSLLAAFAGMETVGGRAYLRYVY